MKINIMILLSLTLASTLAFAGNGGGTMGMLASDAKSPEGAQFVKFVGMDRADIVFEHFSPNAKNEVITKFAKMRAEEFTGDNAAYLEAIKKSEILKDWAEVK